MPSTRIIGWEGPMQRWYEHDPTLKRSIDLLQVFPDEVLTVIAEGMNNVAEQKFKARELLRDYKTLGQDKVLSLYKSKKRQRSYDKNPNMTTFINYCLLLPETHLSVFAKQVLELVNIVQDYLDECEVLKVTPDVTQIQSLRDEYIRAGGEQARATLEQYRQELKEKTKEKVFVQKLAESGDGLKLNFKRVD